MLLLTRSPAYRYLQRCIVAEVTRTVRGIPQEVLLGKREGLRALSVANFDNVHVVPIANLEDRIGVLAARKQTDVKRALGFALAWPEFTEISLHRD